MSDLTPASHNGALMGFIERAARDPEFDIQKFGELLRMQRDVTHEQARQAFNRSMAEAQAEMEPVIRTAVNSHIKSKYAKLETIDAAMRPIYTRHGFSVRFGSAPSPREEWMRIVCTVAHAGGYSEENHLDAPLDTGGAQGRSNKNVVQAVGSSITYLRRYLLTMVFNIVLADDPDDDDGVAAGPGSPTRPPLSGGGRVAPAPAQAPPNDPAFGHLPIAWQTFMSKLRGALDEAQSEDAVTEISTRPTVSKALTNGPQDVPTLIQELLADAWARFKDAAPEWTEPGTTIENDVPPELRAKPETPSEQSG